MKKIMFMFAACAAISLASCDTNKGNGTDSPAADSPAVEATDSPVVDEDSPVENADSPVVEDAQ